MTFDHDLKATVRTIPDYPKKGILFRDITTLLADARAVATRVDGMRSRAKALGMGLEPELSIVVDVMFPTCLLVRALEQFQREFPTVSLRLHMEALGAVAQMVAERRCQLGGDWS